MWIHNHALNMNDTYEVFPLDKMFVVSIHEMNIGVAAKKPTCLHMLHTHQHAHAHHHHHDHYHNHHLLCALHLCLSFFPSFLSCFFLCLFIIEKEKVSFVLNGLTKEKYFLPLTFIHSLNEIP